MQFGLTPIGADGSFIAPSCPKGYFATRLPRSAGSFKIEYRCTPKPVRPVQPASAPPPPPITVSPRITVSPAMQQAFTPQFSPVLQQMQDSPYAGQAAQPTQTAAPAQTAETAPPPVTPSPPPTPTRTYEEGYAAALEREIERLRDIEASKSRTIEAEGGIDAPPPATLPLQPEMVRMLRETFMEPSPDVPAEAVSAPSAPAAPDLPLPYSPVPTQDRPGPIEPKKTNFLPLLLIGGAVLLFMNQPQQNKVSK